MNRLVSYISECIDEPIVTFKPVSGGSISSAYRLETGVKAYFLKVNRKPTALPMFQAEKEGLRAIEESGTIAVPHVHLVGSLGSQAFLLMDHVESKRPDESDYRRLGSSWPGYQTRASSSVSQAITSAACQTTETYRLVRILLAGGSCLSWRWHDRNYSPKSSYRSEAVNIFTKFSAK